MRATFRDSVGRHKPFCGGRCLVAHVKADQTAVIPSALLIILPTAGFLSLRPAVPWAVGAVLLLVASLANLCAALCTEPGLLPTDEDLAPPREGGRGKIIRVSGGGEKADLAAYRAKVCRQTENCVENFDHYCPWVGNAVGRRNYWYFVAFVCCVTALSLLVLAGSVVRVVVAFESHDNGHDGDTQQPIPWTEVATMTLVAYTFVVLCSVASLLSYHARLIAINQTTNENLRGTYYSAPNPHDRGPLANFRAFALQRTPPSRFAFVAARSLDRGDIDAAENVEMTRLSEVV